MSSIRISRYGFIRSKSNPADDPTRSQTIREAKRSPPNWWKLEKDEDYEELDKFLEENHVHPMQVSELPDPAEPLPEIELDGRSSREVKRDRGREGRGARRTEADRTEDESTEAEKTEDAEIRRGEAESVEGARSGDRGSREELRQNKMKLIEEGPEGQSEDERSRRRVEGEVAEKVAPRWMRGREKEWELLKNFKRSQFVVREGFSSLEEALEEGPGLLDLYSGKRGFARAFVEKGCPWALCFDLKHGEDEDLLEPNLQTTLKLLLGSSVFMAMSASPVCASFSTAITPPWRTKDWPRGRPGLTEVQREKIKLGHEQLAFTIELVEICLRCCIQFWVENPEQSWFWKIDKNLSWEKILNDDKVGDFRVDQCCYGTPWRKRTRFRTSCHLRNQKQLCKCKGPHVTLRGRSKEHGMNFTKLAESYPRRLCAVLAAGMAWDCGLQSGRRHVSVSDCVFSNHKRVGEAKNPGPRRNQVTREGAIDDIQLLEPQTVRMRAKLWTAFSKWVDDNIGEGALDNMLEAPYVLVKLWKLRESSIRSWGPSALFSTVAGSHAAGSALMQTVYARGVDHCYKVGTCRTDATSTADPRTTGCCNELAGSTMGLAEVCEYSFDVLLWDP